MRKFLFLASIVAFCFFSSCNDDDLDPNKNPSGETELDDYLGEGRELVFEEELAEYEYSEFKCCIQAENGDIITRRGSHARSGRKSTISFVNGLRDGEYRILSFNNQVLVEGHDSINHDFPMGCKIKVQDSKITVESRYNTSFKMFVEDEGTDSVFIISAPSHFVTLREIANDAYSNALLKDNLVYKIVADIDMDDVCFNTNWDTGWVAIGLVTSPFRGVIDGQNHKISKLWGGEDARPGMALFGYVEDAVFKNLTIEKADIRGNFGVATLVGASINPGNGKAQCTLINCHSVNNTVYGTAGSLGIGGLVGVVDKENVCSLQDCTNNGSTIEGDYSVGGLVGASCAGSTTYVQGCSNGVVSTSSHTTPAASAAQPTSPGTIIGNYSCTGGIIGSSDSLVIIGCVNEAPIVGGFKYTKEDVENGGVATGGIVGGAQTAIINACTNNAEVSGKIGVGGIVGSTRAGITDVQIFQNAIVMSSKNTGNISGSASVGGICGEAQFGGYTVYNSGTVTANDSEAHVGGIVGHASMGVVYNAVNTGLVDGTTHCAGGIIGKTNMGSVFCCQNFGTLNAKANYKGGVIGRAGNYMMVHYCFNAGKIPEPATYATGGIVGEIGDPREWTGVDIAECIIGAVGIGLGVSQCVGTICEAPYTIAKGLAKRNGTALAEVAATALQKTSHIFMIGVKIGQLGKVAASLCLFAYNKIAGVSTAEAKELQSNIDLLQQQRFTQICADINNVRSDHSMQNVDLPDGLDKEVAEKFLENTNSLMEYYFNGTGETNDNQLTIETNLNTTLGDREDEVKTYAHNKHLVNSIIGGACAAIGIAALVVTGGATALGYGAVVIASQLVGGVASVVGGINSVNKGMRDYEYNVVVMSQCVNAGEMKASSGNCGGIVGSLQQFSALYDCMNIGAQTNTTSGGGQIIGFTGSKSSLHRCLMLGKNWGGFPTKTLQTRVDIENNYTYKHNQVLVPSITPTWEGTLALDANELCDYKNYQNWDFTSALPRWEVVAESGNYPVPCKSEMQEPLQ